MLHETIYSLKVDERLFKLYTAHTEVDNTEKNDYAFKNGYYTHLQCAVVI